MLSIWLTVTDEAHLKSPWQQCSYSQEKVEQELMLRYLSGLMGCGALKYTVAKPLWFVSFQQFNNNESWLKSIRLSNQVFVKAHCKYIFERFWNIKYMFENTITVRLIRSPVHPLNIFWNIKWLNMSGKISVCTAAYTVNSCICMNSLILFQHIVAW